MILTLKELADYLRVNERTILRMVKNDQIKGTKIGGQWRFSGSQMDALFFPESEDGFHLDEHPLCAAARSHIGLPLSRIFEADRMVLDMQASDAEEAILELADHSILNEVLVDVKDLQERILAREKLLSTGVGRGIAVPHPRDPVPTLRAPAVVVVGRSLEGIDFGASDGVPVKLIFLLCSQNIEVHLHMMGQLSRLLRKPEFLSSCLGCGNSDEVMKLVLGHEREQFLGGQDNDVE